ncbi:MAG: iron-sulfur cluster-binding protein [Elusimicrobia bacterium RIFOXYB2_FULL_49_7]|nr:MAG: iron-sulfur cluster-binding protein [Elusimicrobia bacterium RIFOXYB2_FULL_49_7]
MYAKTVDVGDTDSKRSTVAVFKTAPERVLDDYKRLMEAAGLRASLDPSVGTIVKNNISWHIMYPSANTTPWQLEAVLAYLSDCSFKEVVVVQNETVVTSAAKGERNNRYVDIYRRFGVKVLHNFKPQEMRFVPYRPKARMNVLDRIYPDAIRIPDYFIGRNIVHLPTVKCHIYTGMTGAMKNAFGGLLDNSRHYCHSRIHETLVDLLAIQREIHPGIFTVMDGTTAGNGPGPRTMEPVEMNVLLASADPVAADAVSCRLMGLEPDNIRCIRLAHEQGLGCGRLSDIHTVGTPLSEFRFQFRTGQNFASRTGRLLWFGPLRALQRLAFHTPLVYIFIFASAFYHDRFWYPILGRTRVERWLKRSPWGALFQRYKE